MAIREIDTSEDIGLMLREDYENADTLPWIKEFDEKYCEIRPGVEYLTHEVITVEKKLETIHSEIEYSEDQLSAKERQFMREIEAGRDEKEAAASVNMTPARFYRDFPKARLKVMKLIEENHLNAEVRKEMVRSGLNRVFMENVDGNLKEQKVALAAAKEIAKDPSIGLVNQTPEISVPINIALMSEIFERNKDKRIPGLDELLEEQKKIDEN